MKCFFCRLRKKKADAAQRAEMDERWNAVKDVDSDDPYYTLGTPRFFDHYTLDGLSDPAAPAPTEADPAPESSLVRLLRRLHLLR